MAIVPAMSFDIAASQKFDRNSRYVTLLTRDCATAAFVQIARIVTQEPSTRETNDGATEAAIDASPRHCGACHCVDGTHVRSQRADGTIDARPVRAGTEYPRPEARCD